MKNIVIITGSARPQSVNQAVVALVEAHLKKREDVSATVANLAELALPFFDGATAPSAENFVADNDGARRWTQLIADADGVIFVSPEYNHSLSALQKNAIDWIYKEWKDKPAAFVGYGWHYAHNSFRQLQEINSVINMKLGENMTGLQFARDIAPDGAVLDAAGVERQLSGTIDELLAKIV